VEPIGTAEIRAANAVWVYCPSGVQIPEPPQFRGPLPSFGKRAPLLHGIPLCGVPLGLADGQTSTLGVIDLPFLGLCYSAAAGRGATCDEASIHASPTSTLDAAIAAMGDYAVGGDAEAKNRLRLALTRELAARVQRVRMFGSAAVDLAWVADGTIDANIMLSSNPWDTAADVLIAREPEPSSSTWTAARTP
jgi:myo-inositol-1(or 4)-monophosphatase